MAQIYDRWHKSRPEPGAAVCAEHGKIPTAEHGGGRRWQVRWSDGGHQHRMNFAKRSDADRQLARLGADWCLVRNCRYSAVTEPPVLLCAEHRDLLIQQATRKRPAVHEPIVYFIRNGNRIKIGWTTNLKARLSSLALPRDAVALTIDGGPSEEEWLHRKFSKARVGRSEWFEAIPELEEFIAGRKAVA